MLTSPFDLQILVVQVLAVVVFFVWWWCLWMLVVVFCWFWRNAVKGVVKYCVSVNSLSPALDRSVDWSVGMMGLFSAMFS